MAFVLGTRANLETLGGGDPQRSSMQNIMDEERALRAEMSRLVRELEACDQLRAMALAATQALATARKQTESAKDAVFLKGLRMRIARAHLKNAVRQRRRLIRKAARKSRRRQFIERELNALRREYAGPALNH